jgi:hypothetical protein
MRKSIGHLSNLVVSPLTGLFPFFMENLQEKCPSSLLKILIARTNLAEDDGESSSPR